MFEWNRENLLVFLKGILIGIAVSMLFVALFAGLLTFTDLDRAYAEPMATVSLTFGTLASACVIAYSIGEKGYLIGFAVGGIWFLLFTVVGWIIHKGGFTATTIFRLILLLLGGMVGGMIGVNRKCNKKFI